MKCEMPSGGLADIFCSLWFVVVCAETKFGIVSDRF
jgi:hypothetical protein